ncbi:hypothetical protein PVAND_009283 [Polypedilum vanderplanki]|uniref:Kinesin-like protein n=1 Tax=Polypedilum vanderplanki TaxID=319348 RepID=A0A9J6CDA1_POLVA|nr:hypothetical protein PVAND_009283 [Polypedilum vanderplanki]
MEGKINAVQVYLKIRSPHMWESNSPIKSYIDYDKSTDQMLILEKRPYIFDKIFFSKSSQDEIYKSVEHNHIENFIKGYNSGIFAQGASGAGKSCLIFGLNNSKGLISQCLDEIFKRLDFESCKNCVSVQIIEIYNDKVYDLLGDPKTDIYTKGTTYTGSSAVKIRDSIEAEELLKKAKNNRHIRSTLNNASSSRSHLIFTVYLNVKSANSEKASVLHLVDLAGSEGIRDTNHVGTAALEGIKINQGLLALRNVIAALNAGKKFIPYRDTVLTTVLKDCLNTESFLTIFACITPARKDKSKTLDTINFAQMCKQLDTKVTPEMNSYLKEQERLNARTPLKPYQPQQRSDRKTPGNVLPSKLSSTKSTAKTVSRFNSFITPSAKKNTTIVQSRYTDVSKINKQNMKNKESIDTTFSIMNVSTSTEMNESVFVQSCQSQFVPNANSSTSQINFSPIMRQIEATIDKKLTNFMQSFQFNLCSQTKDFNKTTDFCIDIKKAVRDGMQELQQSFSDSMKNVENDTFIEQPALSSTIVRQGTIERITNGESHRAVRRLTSIDFTSQDEITSNGTIASPQRVKVFEATSNKENATKHAVRRSKRISMMQAIVENKSHHNNVKDEQKVVSSRKRKQETQNKLLTTLSSAPIKSKKERQKAMLELLNTGSMKDLQYLPAIGQKTAYEIILKRSVKGVFKSLDDVKKALMKKDKQWDNFLEKNMLK